MAHPRSPKSTLPKFNSLPLKSYRNPIGKARLPSTIFQGRAVKLPWLYSTPGTSSSASSWRKSSSSLSSESVLGVGLPHLRRYTKNPKNLWPTNGPTRHHGLRKKKKNWVSKNLGSVGIRSKHHFLMQRSKDSDMTNANHQHHYPLPTLLFISPLFVGFHAIDYIVKSYHTTHPFFNSCFCLPQPKSSASHDVFFLIEVVVVESLRRAPRPTAFWASKAHAKASSCRERTKKSNLAMSFFFLRNNWGNVF